MKLEERIRELRLHRNLTLKEMAILTDLSVSFLSDVERGRTTPSLRTIETLASAFQISVTDLLSVVAFGGESNESNLPAGLDELINDPEFKDEIDEEWIQLLRKIQLRGIRPQTKREWMELYIYMKRILDDG